MRRRATWYEDLFSLDYFVPDRYHLTQWGRMTHICVGKLTIIGSDNGLSPGRHQVIIWTIAGRIVNWTHGNKLQWNFNRNSNIFIQENASKHVVWKAAAILSRPQCVKRPVIWEEDRHSQRAPLEYDDTSSRDIPGYYVYHCWPNIFESGSLLWINW